MEKEIVFGMTREEADLLLDQICEDVDHNHPAKPFWDALQEGAELLEHDDTLVCHFVAEE